MKIDCECKKCENTIYILTKYSLSALDSYLYDQSVLKGLIYNKIGNVAINSFLYVLNDQKWFISLRYGILKEHEFNVCWRKY